MNRQPPIRHSLRVADGSDGHALLLIDSHGVLRCLRICPSLFRKLPTQIRHWARVLRGRR